VKPGIVDEGLHARLDATGVESIVEYLFARLGLDRGGHWLRFRATDGNLRETEYERGPI
jgi:hypothetical protein